VLDLVVEGLSNKAVANALGLSAKTVEVHRAKVMEKLHARSISDLVKMAMQNQAAEKFMSGRQCVAPQGSIRQVVVHQQRREEQRQVGDRPAEAGLRGAVAVAAQRRQARAMKMPSSTSAAAR
jgi:hypothetical protein